MSRHKFMVGMRVRARHNIIEGDYHKGDRILAVKGQEGEVTKISNDYGETFIYVHFDDKSAWRHTEIICESYDIEPAGGLLDQFVAEVYAPKP